MDAFIGEVRAFTYSFIPQGWLACSGQSVSVQQYQALYSVIGSLYGSNSNPQVFNLPNLNGQAVIGAGTGPGLTPRTIGHTFGAESVALTGASQLPAHTHTLTMETLPPTSVPNNTTAAPVANSSWLSRAVQLNPSDVIESFTQPSAGVVNTNLHPVTIGSTGNSVAHENRQPYLTLVYCICYDGMYPEHP